MCAWQIMASSANFESEEQFRDQNEILRRGDLIGVVGHPVGKIIFSAFENRNQFFIYNAVLGML